MEKNIRVALSAILTMAFLTAIPAFSFAESISWTDNFVEGQAPDLEQCQAWHDFLAQLDPGLDYVTVTMSSTYAPEGITMTDPVAVKELAYLLYTRTSGSVFSDGHTWSVGIGCNLQSCVPSGEGVELRVDLDVGCCCTSSSYIIRPDIGNRNWGGINTPSCTPPNQAMMVEFQINSDTSSTIMIGECDSGVEDIMLSTGDSFSGLIAECAANATNHGSFVSCTSDILNMLKKEGIISGKEKGAIQKCAAKANLP